jgi:hypothetical protein
MRGMGKTAGRYCMASVHYTLGKLQEAIDDL